MLGVPAGWPGFLKRAEYVMSLIDLAVERIVADGCDSQRGEIPGCGVACYGQESK